MKVETEIEKWGNSLALRVTGVMAEMPGFMEGSKNAWKTRLDGVDGRPQTIFGVFWAYPATCA